MFQMKMFNFTRLTVKWLEYLSVNLGSVPFSTVRARGTEKSVHAVQTRGLVSKETVVLRRWGRETQNFEFINWVDKVN